MATGPLSIKLRCASWPQLATIYKRDLSRGTMFLKATTPPALGTPVRIDLTLPSASVIVLTGTVDQHVTDPQRGAGVELKLAPIAPASIYMIESALASEAKRRNTPAAGVPIVGATPPSSSTGPLAALADGEEVGAAEQELVKALLSEADSLRKLNPFLVLGVGYEASDTDVRAAFGELTKRYHPDLFARYESTQLRQVAAEIFILIRDAYRKLGDETGRAQALAGLGRPAAPRAVPLRAPTPPPVPIGPPRPPTPRAPTSQPLPKPPEARLPERPDPPPLPRAHTDHAPTSRPGEMLTAVPRPTPPPSPTPTAPVQTGEAVTARPGETPAIAAKPTPTTTPTPAPESRSSPMPIPRVTGEPGRSQPTPTVPLPPGQSFPAGKVTSSSSMKPASGTEPPPPAMQTDRKPINASPPQMPTDGSDSTALEEMLDAGKLDEALAAYKLMSKKHPADRSFRAGIELCEGLRALTARDRLEAAQRFETALEIDPSNERAARELADMRRQATNERKGLLTRLMGKKES